MDGIVHIAGGETTEVLLAGRTLTLATKTLRQYADIEAFILSQRPDVYRTALEWVSGLDDGLRSKVDIRGIVESAMRVSSRARFATSDELRDYNESVSGQGHRLWLAAKDHHPDFTMGEAMEVVLRLSSEEWKRLNEAFDLCDQRELLKNSSGPADDAGRAESSS